MKLYGFTLTTDIKHDKYIGIYTHNKAIKHIGKVDKSFTKKDLFELVNTIPNIENLTKEQKIDSLTSVLYYKDQLERVFSVHTEFNKQIKISSETEKTKFLSINLLSIPQIIKYLELEKKRLESITN